MTIATATTISADNAKTLIELAGDWVATKSPCPEVDKTAYEAVTLAVGFVDSDDWSPDLFWELAETDRRVEQAARRHLVGLL